MPRYEPYLPPDMRKARPTKSLTTAFLLSFFLGWLGVDRFYIGHVGLGALKLLTLGGFGIWAVIDLFLIQEATRNVNIRIEESR